MWARLPLQFLPYLEPAPPSRSGCSRRRAVLAHCTNGDPGPRGHAAVGDRSPQGDAKRVGGPSHEPIMLTSDEAPGVVLGGVSWQQPRHRDVGIGRKVNQHGYVVICENPQTDPAEVERRVGKQQGRRRHSPMLSGGAIRAGRYRRQSSERAQSVVRSRIGFCDAHGAAVGLRWFREATFCFGPLGRGAPPVVSRCEITPGAGAGRPHQTAVAPLAHRWRLRPVALRRRLRRRCHHRHGDTELCGGAGGG